MSTRLHAIALLLTLTGCRWDHDRHGGFDEPCGREKPATPTGRGDGHGGGSGSGGYGATGGAGRPGGTTDGGASRGGISGGQSDGGASVASAAGSCSTDVMCGAGLVCDQTLGACALPRGGCGTAAFQPTRTTGEVVLLLDRSNSMRDPTPTGTKWGDLTASLDHVLARRSDIAWGLALFPASDARACVPATLAITPAMGSAGAIASSIHTATPTGSGTPTRASVHEAGRQVLASARPTRKYLLLATDGEPNCLPGALDQNMLDVEGSAATVRSLAAEGVGTFVLGVAARSSSASALAAMAQAGGHARQGTTAYFTAGDAGELESALDEVARQIALCTFDLSPPPPAGSTLALSIGGRPFTRNTAHVGDGWDVTAAGRAIELYGAACDAVQAGATVSVAYGCGSSARCDEAAMACVPLGLP